MDLPASTGRSYRAPENQEVVRVDFHDTDPLQYEQPLNVIPVATERNNLSVVNNPERNPSPVRRMEITF